MEPQITNVYGNKIRIRVSGLCWQNGNLLMVNHKGLTSGDFWAPPGGGLEFGESVQLCLEKEFSEETGLVISVGRFLFGCEFLRNPLHSIELFFAVESISGTLRKGDDPELPIIQEVGFLSPATLAKIPRTHLHGIFTLVSEPEDLMKLNGFFRI